MKIGNSSNPLIAIPKRFLNNRFTQSTCFAKPATKRFKSQDIWINFQMIDAGNNAQPNHKVFEQWNKEKSVKTPRFSKSMDNTKTDFKGKSEGYSDFKQFFESKTEKKRVQQFRERLNKRVHQIVQSIEGRRVYNRIDKNELKELTVKPRPRPKMSYEEIIRKKLDSIKSKKSSHVSLNSLKSASSIGDIKTTNFHFNKY